MTPCQRIRRLIDDFVEGEIEEQDRKAVEEHLVSCPTCHHCAKQIQALRMRLKRLRPVHTSDDFLLRLRSRLYEEAALMRTSADTIEPRLMPGWVWGVGVALVGLLILLLFNDRGSPYFHSTLPMSPSSSSQAVSGTRSQENSSEGWPLVGHAPEVSPVERVEENPPGVFPDSIRIREHRDEMPSWIRTVSY